MKKIIRKILKEDTRPMYLNKIVQVMKNDFPLFKNMEDYGFYDQLSEDELKYITSQVFNQNVGYVRYEDEYYKYVYNNNGKEIYFEDFFNGYWILKKYNSLGKKIYEEDSEGKWVKVEYDEHGRRIYFERFDGFWEKYEYNEDGNTIYFEDSMSGVMLDKR